VAEGEGEEHVADVADVMEVTDVKFVAHEVFPG
jgi:hypothetical protein